jgi:two-component system NtrC family sensor kinase
MNHILLVEDSPTQAQQMAWLLQEAGFRVTVVGDAEKGLERLEQETFDAVLTDLVLPGASGFDLCRQIKANPAWNRLPVVVLTSQADPINVLRGLEAGADGFMTKDREPAEIIGRLQRTLSRIELNGDSARVAFLDCEFEIAAERNQLLNVLLAAFEDVVSLNRQFQGTLAELRKVNGQLQESVRSERLALANLQQAQSRLVQTEKLSSLGQMVAGIAHEINNPLAFVSSNLSVFQRDTQNLRELLGLYQQALAEPKPELRQQIEALAEQIDLPYTLSNQEGLLQRSGEGIKRIQRIVKSLREFARLDGSEWKKDVNVNDGAAFAIDLLQERAHQQGVRLEADLGQVPGIFCKPANINQVLFNLLANALDACRSGDRVTVKTLPVPEGVEIHVQDTGRGIDPAIRSKIFDPFFTTKPPGQGTGLGLSISYGIIQDHAGRISFDSVPGEGSHFVVFLPLNPSTG